MTEGSAQRGVIRRDAFGIAAYAGAFGASFGAVSVASGLGLAQTMVLSLVMFTGASQFAFIGVVGSGGNPLAAIPAALLLGVRNSFYGVPISEALGPDHLRGWRRWANAQIVIDETTAMAVRRDVPADQRYAFHVTGVALFCLWNSGTFVGALAGSSIDAAAFGLDAAVPAAFLALLWPRLSDATSRWVAVAGALVATALVPLLPAGVPVLAAAPIAVVAGLLPRRSPGMDDTGSAEPVHRAEPPNHTHSANGAELPDVTAPPTGAEPPNLTGPPAGAVSPTGAETPTGADPAKDAGPTEGAP